MASYRAGFDPPTRPDYRYRDTRAGPHMANPTRVSEEKRTEKSFGDTGSRQVQRQMEPRLEAPKNYGRPSNLPKPRTDTQPLESVASTTPGRSNFGFRRPSTSRVTDDESEPQSERRRHLLTRTPPIVAQPMTTRNINSKNLAEPSLPWPLQHPKQSEPTRGQSSMQGPEELGYYPEPTIPVLDDSPQIIPELDRYRSGTIAPAPANLYSRDISDVPYKLSTQDLPLNPTPLSSGLSGHSQYSVFSGYSASPSTRFTESPIPGPYSRDTTPTSMSSQSPGLMVPLRGTPRLRQGSPIHNRPPLSRRRMGSASEENEVAPVDGNGLPALRESLTSSSSNSTVKGKGRDEKQDSVKKKKKRLSPLPPSPPPRTSSQKFKDTSSPDNSPSKPSRSPARPVMNTMTTAAPAVTSMTSPQSNLTSPNVSQASAPPRRPSRDGTPDLRGMKEEINVVQSNLTGISIAADRRFSGQGFGGGLTASPQLGAATRPSTRSRLPSRSGAPSPVQREPTPKPAGLGIVPVLRPDRSQTHPGLRTPSPSAQTPKHRFGLFGRRTKTAPGDIPTIEKQERPTRKGPAAGTGHEGYRYGSRGHITSSSRDRRPSNAGSVTSQDSYSSLNAMHDPFLSQRMSPVVIAGGGEVVENYNSSLDLSRTESNQSLPLPRPSLDSKGSALSSRSNLSKEASRTTLWPSAMPRNTTANNSSISLTSKGTLVSDTSDNDSYVPRKTLAVRRSLLRLNKSELQSMNLPAPIKIPAASESGLSSLDTTYVSDASRTDTGRRKGNGPAKLTKRSTSPKKWNFFQRSKNIKTEQKAVPVVVNPIEKDVPFYAIIDSSEQEEESIKVLSAEDIEEILREAEEAELLKSGKTSIPPRKVATTISKPSPVPPQQDASDEQVLTSSSKEPGPNGPEIPKMWKMEDKPDQSATRPSRLAQVGRIPKVVTARPETTSPKSFSRPFARISMIKEPEMLSTIDHNSVAVGPSPARSAERSPNSQPVTHGATAPDPKQQNNAQHHKRPFLVISPRKGSEASTSTSISSGTVSSYAGTTAIIPKASDALEEDEVWVEYDDLIGQDDADKVPPSATSSHGVPFQYEEYESRQTRRHRAKESPIIGVASAMPSGDGKPGVLKSTGFRPPSLRTTVKDALGAPSPSTPMSFTDFIAGYGDRNSNGANGSVVARRVSSVRSQNESQPASTHSKSASTIGVNHQSIEVERPTKTEQIQDSPAAQVNLRIGSMTVSKWLTFGHVLFSPARELLQNPEPTKHHSILVIDGLGNDDWSFYAAETYPETTFYNLSPTASRNQSKRMSVSAVALPAPPENHRQVQHLSLSSKFPFTPSTFTVVVLRFPPASPESLMRHLIAESKRVLKPSGYLEMSILDLDMMNMGPKTRRAVRNLKIGITARDPEVNLGSMADTLLRLIGKRGFTDVKSCNVGIPVASIVANSSSEGTVAGSDGGSKKDVSLADLMKDSSAQGDEGITKMVAKVGRWWFSRCYETNVLANDKSKGAANRPSIFADQKIIEESERWETNFKLLVAYAQKPEVPRRRTASV